MTDGALVLDRGRGGGMIDGFAADPRNRQLTPIEMSSPVGVDRPLWQATQRSEV
jgi:hypothetical protein